GGHEVLVAETGRAALALGPEFRPGIVLLDIGLPDMEGYEVARRLTAELGLPGTHIIALSGYGQQRDRLQSQDAGIRRHLVKPVDPEELREVLSGIAPE